MSRRRELYAFMATLAVVMGGFFAESLLGGKVLSPADVLFASASFRGVAGPDHEPANRLLIDPVLQFQPWLEFNRSMLRSGRLPLWNDLVGCGAPHLGNGQAAVFDPFHLIAYLGRLPEALGWMAAARLWFAGLGMFLLARGWGLGPWGRWFAGLGFPFSGFVVAWLLFPVTNVAVWMPWVFLATDRAWARADSRGVAWLALAVGGAVLGGHVQTAAHVLLAAVGYAAWLAWRDPQRPPKVVAWALGVALGLGISAVEVVPLASYLAKSPVWADRDRERPPPWKLAKVRWLDAACTALPSLYGSQRRGQPNLARGLGVHNQNESSGGFAGLATLIWLAPLAWSARRIRPRVRFLFGLAGFGFLAGFQLPPVDNLLRALPVLNVTDNRRMTLWVSFALVALGGIGLDRLAAVRRSRGWATWGRAWVVGSLGLLGIAAAVDRLEPQIRAKALAHYARAAEATPGADPTIFRDRAERQARGAVAFVPRYLAFVAAQGLAMAWLLFGLRRGKIPDGFGRSALLGLVLLDLLQFGWALNPAIPPGQDRPVVPVIARLREEVGRSGRIIALGAELPPNTLMRYGLADARNYDSVEVARSLDWLAPLYDPAVAARTSRREISWARVAASRDRLREAGVRAVVAATPPPSGLGRAEAVGPAWVLWLDAEPLIEPSGAGSEVAAKAEPGRIEATIHSAGGADLIVRQTFDPGWRAAVDGVPTDVVPRPGAFYSVRVPPGTHRIQITYDPIEVRLSLAASIGSALLAVFGLTGLGRPRFTRFVGLAAWTDPGRRVRIGPVTHPRTTQPANSPKDIS